MPAPHQFVDDGSGVSCDECTLHKNNGAHLRATPPATPARAAVRADAERDGVTYAAPLDESRLNAQARKVWQFMARGEWWPLAAVSAATGAPEASVSARLRDFRKPEFGGHEVESRRKDGSSAWEYRLRVRVLTNG